MVPHHIRNSSEIKKVHFYTYFPHGTQKQIFTRSSDSDAFNIFRAQSWYSGLSNGVSHVNLAHLWEKLFKFEI